ncbi:MFS transporter [Pseudomonas nitroreducens]|uniref:MFS transporter n=1 Tax=Pseudomonas nitroreducens TaxID=46680 RepID=UPI00351D040D
MPASFAWPMSLRALRHRNFRLYFAGHAVSTLGTWIQQVALAWLIYRLTDSAALLGITSCLALLPQLFIGPLAGAWIDRHDKRRLLLITQSLMAAQAAVLAILTASAMITPAIIVAMSALLGVLNAFDTPLRQSLLSNFVSDRGDLPNALALNATLFTCSRFVGPPLAGLLLGFTSESVCFSLNALSYLALVANLLRARTEPTTRASGSMGAVFREGLEYAFYTPNVRRLILGVLLVNLTASSYAAVLPVFARDVLSGDAQTLGWLWGAAGLGSLVSSLYLANHQDSNRLPRALLISALISVLGLLLLGFSHGLYISLAAMVLLGAGVTVNNVGTNIILQNDAPDGLRGRVVSIYTATRFGFDAIGGLLAGLLASQYGGPRAMAIAGITLLCYCIWSASRSVSEGIEQQRESRS